MSNFFTDHTYSFQSWATVVISNSYQDFRKVLFYFCLYALTYFVQKQTSELNMWLKPKMSQFFFKSSFSTQLTHSSLKVSLHFLGIWPTLCHALKDISEELSKDFSMHDKTPCLAPLYVSQIVFVTKSQYNDTYMTYVGHIEYTYCLHHQNSVELHMTMVVRT